MNEKAIQALNPVDDAQLEEVPAAAPVPRPQKRAKSGVVHESKPSIIRLKQAQTVRTTGARFKEAREMCNMSLSKAAEKLGYSNPSKLSKVENASDGYPIPLWVLVEASKLYEVSTDFLLGGSEDWERSARMTQEREVSRFQSEQIEKSIRRSCDLSRIFNDELEWASGSIISMAFSIEEIASTLKRVTEINVKPWQEIKGGSKLSDEADKALLLVSTARAGLKRFKRKMKPPMSANDQLGLGF